MTGSESTTPELSRMVKARMLPADAIEVSSTQEERAALAQRFGVASIDEFCAKIELEPAKNGIRAQGTINASLTQFCAVSGESFPVSINEAITFRFVEEGSASLTPSEDEEVDFELTSDDCDEIEYSGDSFDLGEAVAQSLGLAIDPYAEGPNADAVRKEAGIVEEGQQDGPLADALKALTQPH